MATKIGPKTVSQRDRSKALVFCIDAAHSDSYGGEPTTNVFPDPEPAGNFSIAHAAGSAGTISYGSEDGIPHLVISNTTASSGTDYPRVNFNNLTSTVTDGFSISFEAKADDEGKVLRFALYSSGSTKTTQTANLTTEWKKFTFNNITTGFTLDDGYLRPNETYSGNKYIRRIQVEQKTSSTPFTATSRTDENAVKNISGVGAQGTSLEATTFEIYGQQLYKPTARNVLASLDPNKGHIGGAFWDFDGSDEYIDTGLQPDFIHTNATLIMWTRMADITAGYAHGNHNSKRFYMATDAGYLGGGVQNQNNLSSHSGKTLLAARGISNSDWFMGTVVADSGTAKIYVNGDLDSTFSYTQSSGSNPDGNFRIGNWQNSSSNYWWNGEVATCMIWSAALTAKEIKDIYIAQKGRFGK